MLLFWKSGKWFRLVEPVSMLLCSFQGLKGTKNNININLSVSSLLSHSWCFAVSIWAALLLSVPISLPHKLHSLQLPITQRDISNYNDRIHNKAKHISKSQCNDSGTSHILGTFKTRGNTQSWVRWVWKGFEGQSSYWVLSGPSSLVI